ncbi:hypothetical protein [Mycolicibacter nonchromogenicus]|uniref:hypothetical protein n=1 Tax=Mycolicibacter nonchromogenicus TaxID=1782 RepID=UPI001F1AA3EF|nr:hypothetical protein [Mycolicibacter nonchromogenicus]
MNSFSSAFNKAAIALIAAAALAGCGTGQISQTADQASAVNGASATVGDLALRDVRIQATQTGDALQPGETVDLVFVVSNSSADTEDELSDIKTSVGKVSSTGSKTVPVGGVLVVSAPAGPDLPTAPAAKALPEVANANTAAATVSLDKPISNGLTYDFTFTFKNAGDVHVDVPISAGPLSHHH